MTERLRCTFVGPDGRACRQVTGLLLGVHGLPLCAWHDPARATVRRARRRMAKPAEPVVPPLTMDDLPVKTVESLEDAEKLAQWAILQTAIGKLGPRAAMAVAGLCREYRMVHSEADASRRLNELSERVKAARARGVDV